MVVVFGCSIVIVIVMCFAQRGEERDRIEERLTLKL